MEIRKLRDLEQRLTFKTFDLLSGKRVGLLIPIGQGCGVRILVF